MDCNQKLSSENLHPRDQEEKLQTNVDCPICFTCNIPSDDKAIGSTQCSECEKMFHFKCIEGLTCCPVCRFSESPIFLRKPVRVYRQ